MIIITRKNILIFSVLVIGAMRLMPALSDVLDDEIGNEKKFYGEILSLNFQAIEVRAVLQLLADFSNLKLVVSDSVTGSITLHLDDTPWDQALDIILVTQGLAMERLGQVILIASAEEMRAREKQQLESQKHFLGLAALQTEVLPIKYAKAVEFSSMLNTDKNWLSAKGHITADERTNALLIRDTPERITAVRKLIARLDIPVRQVLIESRIVIADDVFAKDLGAKLGMRSRVSKGGRSFLTSGTGSGLGVVNSTGLATDFGNNLNVNLPAIVNQGTPAGISLGFLSSSTLLDLELQALQTESRGEVVSSPRIITANRQKAIIEQGTQIPYQEATSSGATSTSFRKAVMKLEVTPHITPDGSVILDILVNKDSVSNVQSPGGALAIDTNQIQTQVLVNDGETLVLGGIYERSQRVSKTKVPFLGDIPLLGALFRSTSKTNEKFELLIFVTPTIIEEQEIHP